VSSAEIAPRAEWARLGDKLKGLFTVIPANGMERY